ncbi:SDR family NAD(P)-dependent oxidoreductase [Rhodovastum atsumiense]|uniref:SDR family NAD(P)-dependent oxidoreductase n=1 Tax=Rhodovastum atsumiense TaxID=504468 RepID=A0A5M6INT3_9PROT|nr:SDR family NAD(P)-dependent oxidoreductase [Rhodovastum atsumiense]KAA5609911.1 SDR family NAD(P)-dependent oxidoreductase [Rhodovastum atsumiense]CAH2604526.1 SDR family NAD(P)-dependent oxidoreductase [Rhodovastum atsumiense]
MLDPTGRVVMVSGAGRGIGRKVVDTLLAAGFCVSAGLRSPRALPAHERLFSHTYEAESLDSAQAWIDATLARFGRLDGLVNAAGINPMARIEDADETAFDRMWEVNVKGPLRLIRLALPHLKAGGEGRVINLASLSGKRVANENAGYAMSKFALIALTQAVRREGWDHGIRATALCPGFVATDMTLHATHPRDRMTDPADVAALAEMLLRLPNTATIGELRVNCRFEALV